MNNNIFICQLPKEKQNKIKHLLSCYLHDEGFSEKESDNIIKNVMDDKLSIIENVIDIEEFLE